jgi:hypothetical protein
VGTISNSEKPELRRFVVAVLSENSHDSPVYQPWLNHPPADIEVRIVPDFDVRESLPADVDLVITHNHYRWDELAVLRQTMLSGERGVLVLADGILEFRNSWQNPTIPAGSLLQPAMAHKIATIGPAQSRWLESWGNQGCCETVGLPRLDATAAANGWQASQAPGVGDREAEAAQAVPVLGGDLVGGPSQPTLLICSARTPAFSEAQWDVTLGQFRALADYLRHHPLQHGGRPVAVRWRVAERIESVLNLSAEVLSSGPLTAELERATAVITMPSTVQLEAMLYRRPVATLDFFHLPNYVPAAWQITAQEHFASIIPQLFAPCPLRQFYQDQLLRDQLLCDGPASERMWALIAGMARIAGRQRQRGQAVRFPRHVLSTESNGDRRELPVASQIDWARLQPLREAWRQQSQAAKVDVWELTEVEAALLRARQYSDERGQLHRLVETHRQTVQTYEYNIAQTQKYMSFMQNNLNELQPRCEDTKRRLEQRNAEFAATHQRVLQLAAEKLAAHEKLKEAYADAQRKQERVNELRTQYQELRAAYESLVNRTSGGKAPSSPSSS